ncbi:MAG: T9SS type A sorting domain-containing protein [Dysgonamonadaceae bacterium]|nr:T9SS type A sorting domain-containing protein [Dysgonamonadaceae bacterium]
MKMKHLLLVSCLATTIFTAQAQWSKTYQPRKADIAANNDLATIDSQGNVIVAGIFNEEFKFGTTDLSPIAKSTYLVKYNASGEEQWAVAFSGSATVTALTTDPANNTYIAGNFADEVVFGSTDGNTQTKRGILDDDSQPITDQGACFLAKYSQAGILLKIETYLPGPLNITDPEIMYDGYFNLKCSITHLEFSDKLYASVITTGIVENNDITLNGTYYDIFGSMYENIQSAALISLNDDLQFSKLYIKLCPPDGEAFQFDVKYPQFNKSGNAIYFAVVTLGNQKLAINGTEKTINLPFDGENFSMGYIIVKINATTGEEIVTRTFQATAQDYYALSLRTLNSLFYNNNLLITGTFNGNLTFDETVSATEEDIFAVALDAMDLSQIVFAKSSNTTGNESFASAAIYDGKLNVAYNTANQSSGIFSVNLTDGVTNITSEEAANTYTNALFAAGSKLVKVKATTSSKENAVSTVTVSSENVATAIHTPGSAASAIRFHPNPVVNTLYLSETGNVDIYNTLGVLVKQAVAVNQVSVENLPAGIYFAVVKNAGNTGKIKFVKN